MENRARPLRNLIAFPGTEDDLEAVADSFATSARLLDAVATPITSSAMLLVTARGAARQAGAA